MSDDPRWLDQFDRVVASAAQHLSNELLVEVARIGRDQRERRAYAGNVLLVGLAGGTGSGKSSLLNALAEMEVSPSGAMRPTTSEALAWVPSSVASRLEGLFKSFGITEVVTHDREVPVAILDLPDVDSVDGRHRAMVAALLPIIDLVIWVVDPEKYRDRVLHTEHLTPLTEHHESFRFVLNQVDRVSEGDLLLVLEDFALALEADGVPEPVIWPAAADPAYGPPIGVETIWEALVAEFATRVRGKDARLISELKRGLGLLAPYLEPIGFGPRWDFVKQGAAALWVEGKAAESIRVLRVFLMDLSGEAPDIDGELDVVALIGAPSGTPSAVARHFDATLGRRLRDQLRARATTRALADELWLSLP